MTIGVSLSRERAWCSFRLADDRYGVELEHVQEVLRPQPVTRVPAGPAAIAGLINLRGRIVPVVDLRVLLGRGAGDETSFLVVVRSEDGPVALLVDEIGDVERVRDGESAPTLPGAGALAGDASDAPLVAATLARPDHLLVVLDLARVLDRAFEPPGHPTRPPTEARS